MKKHRILWLLWILIAFSSVSFACIPSETLRAIISHRREFLAAKANVTDKVMADPKALEILLEKSDKRSSRNFRANDGTEEDESAEDSVTEAPVTTTTTTFKPDTIDDP